MDGPKHFTLLYFILIETLQTIMPVKQEVFDSLFGDQNSLFGDSVNKIVSDIFSDVKIYHPAKRLIK